MANLFPDLYPERYNRKPRKFQTRVVAPTGLVQINTTTDVDQYSFDIGWGMLSAVQLDQIIAHFKTNGDQDAGFTFYDFWSRAIPMMIGAVGNGTTGPYILPSKSGSGYLYQLDGTPTAGTPNLGVGGEGEDGVTFGSVVGAGVQIGFSATSARRRFLALWVSEEIEERHVEADNWALDIELIQRVA